MNINQSFKSPFDAPEDVGQLVSLLLSNASILAGVMFLIFVIIAGYTMLSSAGSGDPQKFAKGRDVIVWAFVGFLIIFGAYWIIQLLQMIFGLQGGPTDILK